MLKIREIVAWVPVSLRGRREEKAEFEINSFRRQLLLQLCTMCNKLHSDKTKVRMTFMRETTDFLSSLHLITPMLPHVAHNVQGIILAVRAEAWGLVSYTNPYQNPSIHSFRFVESKQRLGMHSNPFNSVNGNQFKTTDRGIPQMHLVMDSLPKRVNKTKILPVFNYNSVIGELRGGNKITTSNILPANFPRLFSANMASSCIFSFFIDSAFCSARMKEKEMVERE